MDKQIFRLKNNIAYIYKKNDNTPRMAFCLTLSINNAEKLPGVYSLLARLLMQGTINYSSEELANEFEKYAIDFSIELLPNFLRIKFVCLNEDFSKAIELLNEVVKNSTFEEFEKERIKIKGEITADLDSPRATAMDAYYRAMFGNHYYGNSMTRVLENIDSITKEDVVEAYNSILNNSKKVVAVVGALDNAEIMPQLEATVGEFPQSIDCDFNIDKPELNEDKEVITVRSDLNQAHILKGWQVGSFNEEYPVLILLNIILGASGLSSRLFLELRDKKGLAYVVRSTYETFKLVGNFMIYIATEPKNIDVSLKGFQEEIEKVKTVLVPDKELEDAKNNFIGKCAFLSETNIQQACTYARYEVLGLGYDFAENLKESIKSVTSEQILDCAKKYFSGNSVLSIIKP